MDKSALLLLPIIHAMSEKDTFGTLIDPLGGIDIRKEYALIQQKKSRLSSKFRKMVIERYEVMEGDK